MLLFLFQLFEFFEVPLLPIFLPISTTSLSNLAPPPTPTATINVVEDDEQNDFYILLFLFLSLTLPTTYQIVKLLTSASPSAPSTKPPIDPISASTEQTLTGGYGSDSDSDESEIFEIFEYAFDAADPGDYELPSTLADTSTETNNPNNPKEKPFLQIEPRIKQEQLPLHIIQQGALKLVLIVLIYHTIIRKRNEKYSRSGATARELTGAEMALFEQEIQYKKVYSLLVDSIPDPSKIELKQLSYLEVKKYFFLPQRREEILRSKHSKKEQMLKAFEYEIAYNDAKILDREKERTSKFSL